MVSKVKENKGAPMPSLPRRKPQTLNRRPLNQGQASGRKLDNSFQRSLGDEPSPEADQHEEHAVFEHEHDFEEEKAEAVNATVAHVEYGLSRATQFSQFIKAEGQNAIVVSEILGRPKGWE